MVDDKLSFKISTGLKDIIGRDLITDDYIAIFELVKNSYDAHAKNVIIQFDDNKITLSDDGKGMDINDLKNKWLFVAYSAKKDGTEDKDEADIDIEDSVRTSYRDKIQEKRYYAGAKGIGRFSCDRLGNNLILTTGKEADVLEQIVVDWTKFEGNQDKEFAKVKVPHKNLTDYKIPFPKDSNHGTILEISNLSEKWDRDRIKILKHSLEKLINPFSETNDFNIEIVCERYLVTDKLGVDDNGKRIIDRDKINGPVRNSILEILNIKTTQIDVKIEGDTIETKLIDRGTLIYHIKEKNYYKSLITNLKINLYFLNRSAKTNFGKKMGIQPVNYGSVFLFKNGFRVQPYGNTGDDSWGLDFRSQQGYNRFLSTRDLFGRVDITTENAEQFKEVSSRDGGLVETFGYTQLMEAFKEMGLKRLERYVVGVLWGEAFLRKKYFKSDSEGKKLRDSLLEKDKDAENYNNAKANIGSKIDFIQLIKSLSDDKNVEIIEYDKNLVDLVNENIEDVQPKFLKDLEKIAESTNDNDLREKIILTEQNFKRLEQEKEAAEKKALEEERLRKEAEQKAKEAEEEKKKAEDKAKREEEKRRQAELETERKEKERYKAELEKLKAEQKAKEEEEKRLKEQEKNKDLTDELSLEKQKTTYLNATRKTLSDDAEQLIHSIDLYVGNAMTFLKTLFDTELDLNNKLKEDLYFIKSNLDKALKVSNIIIKSNFDYKSTNHKVELAQYIEEYFNDFGLGRKDVKITIVNDNIKHLSYISTIDIDIIIDNLISNSLKADAKQIFVELSTDGRQLMMRYYDDGIGLSDKFIKSPQALFDLGTRDSNKKGSGIGMYDIQTRLTELGGSISFIGNNTKLKGAGFQLIFK